jgi:hypothetical protein
LGHRINSIGLFLSLAYLAWAFAAGEFVEGRMREKLARQAVSYTHRWGGDWQVIPNLKNWFLMGLSQ